MATCCVCKKRASRYDDVITCSALECGRIFHPDCVSLSTEAFTDLNASGSISEWRCADCVQDVAGNASIPHKVNGGDFATLVKQVAEIHSKVSGVDFRAIQDGLKVLQTKVLALETALALKDDQIVALKKQVDEDRNRYANKFNELEYNTKKKNVIIYGIPATRDENIQSVFGHVQRAIHSAIPDSDVLAIHRLPERRRDAAVGTSRVVQGGTNQPIIVSFKNTAIKKDFLMKKKSKQGLLTTADIGMSGPSRNIYFNDQLTELDAALFRKARAFKLSGEFKFVWTDMGRILMRKTSNSPIIAVRGENDLPR